MEALGLDLKLLVAQIVNFAILFFVLTKFLYKPLLKLLDERKKKVEETLTNSLKIEERLVKLEEEKKKVLESEREKGKTFAAELIAQANQEKEKIISEAKSAANREAEKGIERIRAEETEIAARLKKDFTKDMVERIVSKLKNPGKKGSSYPILKNILK